MRCPRRSSGCRTSCSPDPYMSISEGQQKTNSSNHKAQTPNQTRGDPWHRAFHYDIVIMDAQTPFRNNPSGSARCSAIAHRRIPKGYRITSNHKLPRASETIAISSEVSLSSHQSKLDMVDIGASIVSHLIAATVRLVLLHTPHGQLHITSQTSGPIRCISHFEPSTGGSQLHVALMDT